MSKRELKGMRSVLITRLAVEDHKRVKSLRAAKFSLSGPVLEIQN